MYLSDRSEEAAQAAKLPMSGGKRPGLVYLGMQVCTRTQGLEKAG